MSVTSVPVIPNQSKVGKNILGVPKTPGSMTEAFSCVCLYM